MPSHLQLRAKLAGATRHGHDQAELDAIRADLRTANTEAAIERLLADAPPLSAEQRLRLASILLGPAEVAS